MDWNNKIVRYTQTVINWNLKGRCAIEGFKRTEPSEYNQSISQGQKEPNYCEIRFRVEKIEEKWFYTKWFWTSNKFTLEKSNPIKFEDDFAHSNYLPEYLIDKQIWNQHLPTMIHLLNLPHSILNWSIQFLWN